MKSWIKTNSGIERKISIMANTKKALYLLVGVAKEKYAVTNERTNPIKVPVSANLIVTHNTFIVSINRFS
nr:hypothetical protein [Mycoplasmopsis bovis]